MRRLVLSAVLSSAILGCGSWSRVGGEGCIGPGRDEMIQASRRGEPIEWVER